MSIFLSNAAKLISISLVLFAGVIIATPQTAAAAYDIPAGGVELEGFAWSGYAQGSNVAGVGWISMNCSNPVPSFPNGTCASEGGIDYAVTVESDGNLSGYAWSSTVGWISFDPAGSYPSGDGVLDDDAQVIGGSFTGNLNFGGWARVCAAAANPATCSGVTNPNAGGWDGWIALGGTAAGGYGITMTPTGAADGSTNYAWGGPIVTGWIDFSPSGTNPVSYSALTPPSVTFNCPNTSATAGADVDCNYTVDDPLASCQLTDDQGSPTRDPLPSNTSLTVNPDVDTVYTLVCENSDGLSAPATELVTIQAALPVVAPNPVISITVPDIVRSGTAAEVDITVTSVGGSFCEVYGPGLTGINFTVPVAGSYATTSQTAGLTNKTNIAIECSVVNGTPFRQGAAIEVTAAVQEI